MFFLVSAGFTIFFFFQPYVFFDDQITLRVSFFHPVPLLSISFVLSSPAIQTAGRRTGKDAGADHQAKQRHSAPAFAAAGHDPWKVAGPGFFFSPLQNPSRSS